MAPTCKKHGKPRDVIYDRKMPSGAHFRIVGCADCAAEAREGVKPRPPRKPPTPINLRRF